MAMLMPRLQLCSVKLCLQLIAALSFLKLIGCCSTFIPALPTCPGDAALFHCTVTDPFKNGLTRWKLNETSCTLDHDANVDYRTVMCLPLVEEFTAMRTMPSGTCFPSTLTVMASPELNMTSIECSFAGSIAPKSDNLIVIGPPSVSLAISEGDIHQTSASTASVVLRWEVNGDNISRVVVTSSPALPCGSQCEVGEGERELNQTVQFRMQFNITVTAENCEGRQNGSVTVQLLLRVPGVVDGFSVKHTYSNTSGNLMDIQLSWSEVMDPVVKGVRGVSGGVQDYTVTISSTVSFPGLPMTFEVNSSVCTNERCDSLFNATGHLLPSSLRVSAAAVNAIGAGPPSSPVEVSTNNLLAVSIKKSSIGWQFTCSLLSSFPAGASASCRVAFGTDPSFTSLPYSASSTGEAAANGSVTVNITERLNSSTTYYYRVYYLMTVNEGDNRVISVLGSFTTGLFNCDETNLVPDEDNIGASDTSIKCAGDQLGFASEGSTSLRGVVCYTGTSPGSTAVYSASPGCALSQESRVQTCMDNGLWSGAPAVVVSRGLSDSEVVEIAFGAILLAVGVVLLIIGAVVWYRRWKGQGAASGTGCKRGKNTSFCILWILAVLLVLVLALLLIVAMVTWIIVIVFWLVILYVIIESYIYK